MKIPEMSSQSLAEEMFQITYTYVYMYLNDKVND